MFQASNGSATGFAQWQCMKGKISTIPLLIRNLYAHSVAKYVTKGDLISMGFVYGIFWKIQMHHSNDVLMWLNQVNRPVHNLYQEMKKGSKLYYSLAVFSFSVFKYLITLMSLSKIVDILFFYYREKRT